jgi:hypothetical protein
LPWPPTDYETKEWGLGGNGFEYFEVEKITEGIEHLDSDECCHFQD